jgi:hypothetical protein
VSAFFKLVNFHVTMPFPDAFATARLTAERLRPEHFLGSQRVLIKTGLAFERDIMHEAIPHMLFRSRL